MVEDGAFSHKIDCVLIFQETLNLKGHLNQFIGLPQFWRMAGFYLGVAFHREGSALQPVQKAC